MSSFSNDLETLLDIPIITAATALDNTDGSTTILILHQALYMSDKVENIPLCSNQMRHYGIDVDDVSVPLAPINKPLTHSIYAPKEDFSIPLSLNGIISCFQTRTPTWQELDTCKWVIQTNHQTWDPHSEHFMTKKMPLLLEIGLLCPVIDQYKQYKQVNSLNCCMHMLILTSRLSAIKYAPPAHRREHPESHLRN